jgi:hypothetical protein
VKWHRDDVQSVVAVLTATPVLGRLTEDGIETVGLAWYPLDDLPSSITFGTASEPPGPDLGSPRRLTPIGAVARVHSRRHTTFKRRGVRPPHARVGIIPSMRSASAEKGLCRDFRP